LNSYVFNIIFYVYKTLFIPILIKLPSLRIHWYLCQLPFSVRLFADKCHGLGYNLDSSCQSIGIELGPRTGNGQGWPASASCLGKLVSRYSAWSGT